MITAMESEKGKMTGMKRIMIFGRTGSGKSTFAVRLAQALELPLYHLDQWFYTEQWVERDRAEFLAIQQNLVDQDHWMIDGNSLKSLEMRYCRADTVIYVCLPRWLCLLRLLKRRFFKDRSIQDRAPNCPEKITLKLLQYTWTFEDRTRDQIVSLRAAYPNVPFYEVRTQNQLDMLFQKLVALHEADQA